MKNIFLSLFLYVQLAFTDTVKCNYCNNKVSATVGGLDVSYQLCKFETAFSIVSQSKPDWLFLGIECDDNCIEKGVTEGLFCHRDGTIGYYELENGLLGDKINKIEFNEAECDFIDNKSSLKVDRYMPNLWLRNQTISYYVSSGINTLNFVNKYPNRFTISYSNIDPILTSGISKNTISIPLLLSAIIFTLFI